MDRQSNARSRAPIRTSLTHPLRIDEVVAGDAGGLIGITFCPGKCGPSISDYLWQRNLAADLDIVAAWKADAVVTLIEFHEFEELDVSDLGDEVSKRGMEWHHLPIADVRPPDQRLEIAWLSSGPRLNQMLRQGGRVLVHCRGGLGRAGTVSARLLIDLGVPPPEAVRQVRAARPRAIETPEQMKYVLNLVRPGGTAT